VRRSPTDRIRTGEVGANAESADVRTSHERPSRPDRLGPARTERRVDPVLPALRRQDRSELGRDRDGGLDRVVAQAERQFEPFGRLLRETTNRGYWFWIDDDDDRKTKRAMTAITCFFTLSETGGDERLPLITIPAQ
jgi:hypothetical protein